MSVNASAVLVVSFTFPHMYTSGQFSAVPSKSFAAPSKTKGTLRPLHTICAHIIL